MGVEAAELPVRQVILYKHGLGYFQRSGQLAPGETARLDFNASEMNDVLKSLTTLDLDGGMISSVSYESTKPVEKRLEDIAIRLPDKNALTGLLAQIKGARVAAELGARKVEGTVIGTETVERGDGDRVLHATYLALLVDGAAVQSFDLIEVKSLTLLDDGLRKDLQHLLDILISGKKKDLKKLTIFGKGSGKRRLLASYTVETPVWKTSYRILLSGAGTRLQGWALVDNTQEEDWDDIALTLVAGLPISFVHDLYSPRYKRRPVVKVQEEEAYAPPLIETSTVLSSLDDTPVLSARRPMGAARNLAAAEVGGMIGDLSAETRSAARERSVQVQTRTVEVGDLFQYEIGNPVSVKRNQSALVPILHTGLEGRRVAVYNPEIREKNPMSAVQLRNTTGMTLEGGPVTVLEDEQYVGESMLETMKPDEERLVPFSVELGCTVTLDDHSDLRDVHFSRVAGGKLHLHRYRIRRKTYVILNKTDRKLDLFLEHRFAPGWELVDTPNPAERTDHFYRFRFDVSPKSATKFVVNEKGEESEVLAVHNANRDQLRLWVESKYIDRKTGEAVEECVQLYEKAAALVRRVQERDKEIGEIFQNQERLRKNLQALGGSQDEKGLRERYVAELSNEEDKIAQYRAESKNMREEKDKREEELRARLGRLNFETAV